MHMSRDGHIFDTFSLHVDAVDMFLRDFFIGDAGEALP